MGQLEIGVDLEQGLDILHGDIQTVLPDFEQALDQHGFEVAWDLALRASRFGAAGLLPIAIADGASREARKAHSRERTREEWPGVGLVMRYRRKFLV